MYHPGMASEIDSHKEAENFDFSNKSTVSITPSEKILAFLFIQILWNREITTHFPWLWPYLIWNDSSHLIRYYLEVFG